MGDKSTKRPWRKNVLWLVSFGYVATVGIFCVLVFVSKMDADAAFNIIQGPLMALIGGTLAIAKDLLQLDQSEESKGPQQDPEENGGHESSQEGEHQ